MSLFLSSSSARDNKLGQIDISRSDPQPLLFVTAFAAFQKISCASIRPFPIHLATLGAFSSFRSVFVPTPAPDVLSPVLNRALFFLFQFIVFDPTVLPETPCVFVRLVLKNWILFSNQHFYLVNSEQMF